MYIITGVNPVATDRPPQYMLIDSIIIVTNRLYSTDCVRTIEGWDCTLLSGHSEDSFTLLCNMDGLIISRRELDDVLFSDVTVREFITPAIQGIGYIQLGEKLKGEWDKINLVPLDE